jgi:hypothetical protein
MVRSEARNTTDRSSRYLQQQCKHFVRTAPVAQMRQQGHITFSIGSCRLEARDDMLVMAVEADDRAGLAKLEEELARHLERLAFRDPPEICWKGLEGLKF